MKSECILAERDMAELQLEIACSIESLSGPESASRSPHI